MKCVERIELYTVDRAPFYENWSKSSKARKAPRMPQEELSNIFKQVKEDRDIELYGCRTGIGLYRQECKKYWLPLEPS